MIRLLLVMAVALAMVVACAPQRDNAHVRLPRATETTVLGPGDAFKMRIVGEKDLPVDYQVAPDGTVTLPYVGQVEVAGLEPQQIGQLVRKELMDKQILTNPDVIVSVTEYRSRKITILGQVQKPGRFPHSPGMTLLQAVSMAGGFTAIAHLDRVNLTRTTADGKSVTVVISANAIMEGRSADIPLAAGDRIYVHERVF